MAGPLYAIYCNGQLYWQSSLLAALASARPVIHPT